MWFLKIYVCIFHCSCKHYFGISYNSSIDRDSFAKLVREVASPDVGKMGIEILSFTIKDIVDKVQYLDSLGKTQTAKVKRDADIGVAEANRDAGIRVC